MSESLRIFPSYREAKRLRQRLLLVLHSEAAELPSRGARERGAERTRTKGRRREAMGIPSDDVVIIRPPETPGEPSLITISCPDKTGLGCDLCRVILLFGLNIVRGGEPWSSFRPSLPRRVLLFSPSKDLNLGVFSVSKSKPFLSFQPNKSVFTRFLGGKRDEFFSFLKKD